MPTTLVPQPCPFDRSRRLTVEKIDNRHHYVHCHECGADGPIASSEASAIERWNTRPASRDGH